MTDVPTGKAVVNIYRTSNMIGAANVWDVYANKEPLTIARSGSSYRYAVDPGRIVYSMRVHLTALNASLLHLFLGNPPVDVYTLNAEPGQTYYLKFDSLGGAGLVPVEKKKGEHQIQKCRLSQEVPTVPHAAAEKEGSGKSKEK